MTSAAAAQETSAPARGRIQGAGAEAGLGACSNSFQINANGFERLRVGRSEPLRAPGHGSAPDAEPLQDADGGIVAAAKDAEQEVVGGNFTVVQLSGLLLCLNHRSTGSR